MSLQATEAPRVIVPLAQVERRTILRAMIVVEHNRAQAARLLGIGKNTLYRKLAQYNYPACLQGPQSSPLNRSTSLQPSAFVRFDSV